MSLLEGAMNRAYLVTYVISGLSFLFGCGGAALNRCGRDCRLKRDLIANADRATAENRRL